jgi:site-specific recombinase XerD
MSQDAIEDCVRRHAAAAALTCPSLTSKNVTPHVLRHSCAVRMLRSGIDIAVIALWMGHESTRTTMIYLVCRELHQTGEGTVDLRRLAA